jgi:hypothetical protein
MAQPGATFKLEILMSPLHGCVWISAVAGTGGEKRCSVSVLRQDNEVKNMSQKCALATDA